MTYDTEQNRVKVAKYRTRKGLRDAGYGDDEIKQILAGVNWATATPLDIIAQYSDSDAQTSSRAATIQSEEPRVKVRGTRQRDVARTPSTNGKVNVARYIETHYTSEDLEDMAETLAATLARVPLPITGALCLGGIGLLAYMVYRKRENTANV